MNPEGLIDANNSPNLVRSPDNPANLVAVHRVDRPRFGARLEFSMDGGSSWASTELPLPGGLDRPYAPDVAFAPDGTLYVVYSNLEGAGNVPANLWISTSADGGRSLSPPSRIAGKLAFQPRLAVAPGGAVHVIWLRAAEVSQLSLGTGANPLVAATSTDGGRSFSEPVIVSDPSRPRVGGASPVVDAEGRLFVLYQDFGGDRRDFENLEGPTWNEPSALVLTRSVDRGHTFAKGIEVDREVVLTRRFSPFTPEYPSLAAGLGRVLYAAWADGRNGDLDVFLRRSGDGGATWAEPVRVNTNRRADRTSQYLPKAAVSDDGRVDILFYDRHRDRRDVLTDVTLSSSDDEGRSFAGVRVSSRAFSSRIGPRGGPLLDTDLGTRLGLLAEPGRSLAMWTDTRLGTADTNRQDIALATVKADEGRPLLTRVPVMVGLGLVGALAVLAAAGRRAGPAAGGPPDDREG